MIRKASCFVLALCYALPASGLAQDASSLEGYFTGKQVLVKVDLPGSQKGVDLKYNKPVPMDWNDYSSRIKSYGIAIHKGEVATITRFTVKNDMIEFQLNGGGFGSFGDDTNTVVSVPSIPKSQYEKDLEKQISTTNDANKKKDLQRDLDRERDRRAHQDAANQSQAQVASQMKAQLVADKRLHGGSRFNLRWQGSIPSDVRNPQSVMQLLADYVDFNASAAPTYNSPPPPTYTAPPPPVPSQGNYGGAPASTQLKRGMKVGEVDTLLGRGRLVSETVSNDGLKTQVIEYRTAESVIDVTFVEGVVVRYSMNSL